MDKNKNNIEKKHYSEEDIALFALGEKFPENKQQEFFDHIEVCFSCKQLYEEMSEYYEAADRPELLLESGGEKETIKRDLKPQYKGSFFSALATSNYYVPAKWVSFVFRRPALSGGGFLFLIALFVLALNFKSFVKDTNPAFSQINTVKGDMEILNKDKEFLWKLHIMDDYVAGTTDWYTKHNIPVTLITDINDDGKNEVLTSRMLLQKVSDKSFLNVYNYKGELINRKSFDDTVSWRGYKYPSMYNFGQIIRNPGLEKNEFDFYVTYNHRYAPGRTLRLDKNMNIIGEFWHKGHLENLFLHQNKLSGKKNIFLCGCDDLIHRAKIIVIDPDKLIGRKEAGSTLGYGFGTTDAEIAAIQFPETDVLKALGDRDYVLEVSEYDDFYDVRVGRYGPDVSPDQTLIYQFSKDYKLISVLMCNGYQTLQNKLFDEGKVKEKWSAMYQKKLMDGVRYWNGKEWQKEWFILNNEK
jgi:hypothetical protein